MALLPKATPTATSPAFENPDDAAAQPAQALAVPTATLPALAVPTANAVAVRRESVNPFESIKGAYHVDFNTLTNLQVTNGNFMDKEGSRPLGDSIVLALMSFQDNYVISPGVDGEQAKKLVKYSDDGIVTKDGLNAADYLHELKTIGGYSKARMDKRVVLVGALVNAGKLPEMTDTLVQIDLPPSSKALFDRYQIQTAYDVRMNKYTAEEAMMLTMTTKIVKNGASQIYTLVNFQRFMPNAV